MALTATQLNPDFPVKVATGRYLDTGTAAAFTITTGFRPKYVKVINTAATGGSLEHFDGMAAASAQKFLHNGAAYAQGSLITSNGITLTDRGFTIGLDTDINVSSEQINWLAIG